MITVSYTILHFVVDGLCSLIISNQKYDSFILSFYIYNFLAFLLQPFIGILIDINKNHKFFLTVSIVFIILGGLVNGCYGTLVFLGIGNAFFHIAGGYEVARSSENDINKLGIFVSTGAIGLTVGRIYNTYFFKIISYLILLAIYLIILYNECTNTQNNTKNDIKYVFKRTFSGKKLEYEIKEYKNSEKLSNVQNGIRNSNNLNVENNSISNKKYYQRRFDKVLITISILSIVIIRSFFGAILKFNVNSNLEVILISIFVALGKVFGGYLYNFFKCKKLVIISFIVGAMLILFINNFVVYLIVLFLINITMPVTLYLINKIFTNQYGFAFGLLASALVPGYMLGLIFNGITNYKIIFIIFTFISTLLIILSDNKLEKYHF